jgi:hypothetical protein
MHLRLISLSIIIFSIAGCNNQYVVTQTPDDVYYSPVNGQAKKKKKNTVYTQEERTFRMSRHSRRWRFFDDDFGYDYNPYHYGFNYGHYYNPYYYPMPVFSGFNIRNPKNTTPRMTNLNSYNFQEAYVPNPKYQAESGSTRSTRRYNNSNNPSSGNTRTILSPGSSDGRNYSPTKPNTVTPGSAPVSRPSRN